MNYKYLHILSHQDTKFYPDFVKMINESKEFNVDEFLFITWYKDVYECIKQYKNVLYIDKKNKIYKWLYKSKWIFMHSNFFTKMETILLPKKICKKIIWRTWGHDIRPLDKEKNILKRFLFKLYVKKVNMFKAIGIANDIDAVNVQNVFGYKLNLYKLNYSYKNNQKEIVEKIKKEGFINKKNEIRILLGHNAGKAENHIQNLYRLSRYVNENIKIFIPLSYSNQDQEYIKKIKSTSIDIFGNDKVEFIENFMEYYDYVKLINSMDIAIMDQEFSNGLGNLSLLIYFKKKIFVNKKGNIAQSFINKNITPNYADDIGKIKFDRFIKKNFDSRLDEYINQSALIDKNANINNLKKIIDAL